MKKKMALILACIMMLTSNGFAATEQENYPLRSNYPNGIEPFSESITSVPMEKRQFDCGYERYSEMFKVEQDSCDDQREIVDNSYSGEFAIKISQNTDEYIPVCEGVNFYIPETSNINEGNENIDNVVASQDITIATSGTSVSVSGITNPSTEVCILAKQGDVIKYINQYTADGNGNFEFNFNVSDYGEYNIKISRVDKPLFNYNFSCYPQIVNELSRQGKIKNNRIRLQLKPMENAKNISFYAKAIVDNEGSLQEEYVLLKGKKVEDGIFRVGTELSQGKWQEMELYTEYDSSVVLNSISDIYVKTNTGSKWIIDDIVTDYIGIKETNLDLSGSATENVVYQNGLQFSRTGQDGKYDTDAKVLTAGTEISGKLNGISIDSTVQNTFQEPQEAQDHTSETLLDCDFNSGAWSVHCDDQTMQTVGNSQLSDSSILMTTGGHAEFNLGTLSTEDRTVITSTIDIKEHNSGSNDQAFLSVEMFQSGNDSAYYTTRVNIRVYEIYYYNTKIVLPRIKPNTILKISLCSIHDNYYKISMADFKLCALKTTDWNCGNKYSTYLRTSIRSMSSTGTNVSELPGYNENSYAVKNAEYCGRVFNSAGQITMTWSDGDIFVLRVVNLSNMPQLITYTGFTTYQDYLPYGESDICLTRRYSGNLYINFPSNENIMLISVCSYASDSSYSDKTYYKSIEGLSDNFVISYDGSTIYYTNYNGQGIYKYEFETGEYSKLLDKASRLVCVDKDEKQIVYYYYVTGNDKYYLYNESDNTKTELPEGANYKFNNKGDLYLLMNGTVNLYKEGVLFEFVSSVRGFVFDITGDYMLTYNYSGQNTYYQLYKNNNGSYSCIKNITSTGTCNNLFLSDDLSEVYCDNGYGVNFNSGNINNIRALYKASDNTYLIKNVYEKMAIYNPITKEQYEIPISLEGTCHYNPETKIVTSVRNGCFTRYKLSEEKSTEKYMFSFDGKHSWQTYKNGRWITGSKNSKPTSSEMDSIGMYEEEVNNLSRADFEKLYKNKTDILNLDIAIYMNSNSNELTPVIRNITLSTYETDEPYASFAINNSRYNKADYTNISSVFPVENLDANSECFYLLYLGNEWIYTYKDSEFIRIDFTSIDIPNDRLLAWAKLKQYAMSARELRNIPSEKLNSLFLNSGYANDEFGVLSFIKSEDLEKSSVVIKLQGDKKYTDNGDVVLEIKMNGNDTKVIDSAVFSKEVIDNFLSWVQNRQSGKGDVFFNFKNNETQYFVNYFMIDSIGIFNPTSYYSTSAE